MEGAHGALKHAVRHALPSYFTATYATCVTTDLMPSYALLASGQYQYGPENARCRKTFQGKLHTRTPILSMVHPTGTSWVGSKPKFQNSWGAESRQAKYQDTTSASIPGYKPQRASCPFENPFSSITSQLPDDLIRHSMPPSDRERTNRRKGGLFVFRHPRGRCLDATSTPKLQWHLSPLRDVGS